MNQQHTQADRDSQWESTVGRMRSRLGSLADAVAITCIYNQGIEDRIATFETRLRTSQEIEAWFGGRHPIVVVEQSLEVIAFASASTYRPRPCYDGIAEFSVYVARERRGLGAGKLALSALIQACGADGFWKLVSRVFTTNVASRSLLASAGFREVGVYLKHGMLDGIWRDVVIVEKWIGPDATQRPMEGRE